MLFAGTVILNSGFWQSKILNSGFWQSKISNSGFWQSKILNSRFWQSKILNSGFWQYKILNTGFWQSLTLTLSHNSTEITLLLVNLEIFDFKLSAIMWKKAKHPKMRSDIWSSAVTVVTNNFKYMSSFVYFWFFGCQDRQTGAREAYKNASYWNGKFFVIFSFRSLVHFHRFLNCWPSVLVLPLSKSLIAKQL